MGVFRKFPYTNFHEMNLDWLIDKIRELSEEWFSYAENMDKWKTDIDAAFEELTEYVLNYFEENNIKAEIKKYMDDLKDDGYFEDVARELVTNSQSFKHNIVANKWYDRGTVGCYCNGACYIGGNRFAVAFSTAGNDEALLRIFDINTFEELSATQLTLQHANSLTYDPEEHIIYSCNCYSESDTSVLVPTITKIDVSDYMNPTIIETVTPPLPSYSRGIYSLAYDPITERFYAICTRGVTENEYNRVIIYTKDLTEIWGQQILIDTIRVSSQGIQLAYNNVLYIVYYQQGYKKIVSFNAENGYRLNSYNMPQLFNGYRNVGELQSLVYDYDEEDWFITSRNGASGVRNKEGWQLVELGLYKDIDVWQLNDTSLHNTNEVLNIQVDQGSDIVTNNCQLFPCIMDAINACKTLKMDGIINLGSNPVLGSINISDFNGVIEGRSDNHIQAEGAIRLGNCNLRMSYVDFKGQIDNWPVSGKSANIAAFQSKLTLTGCTATIGLSMTDSILIDRPNFVVNLTRSIMIGASAPYAGSSFIWSSYIQSETKTW